MLFNESHNTNAKAYSTQLGLAASCMLSSPRYCRFPVAALGIWTRHAIIQEQIHFFYDGGGEVQGYLTWARIRPDTLKKCITQPEYILHPTEWNEGNILWLTDFCLLKKYRRYELLALLKQVFGPETCEVYWASRHNPDRNSWMTCNLITGECFKQSFSCSEPG
ncbi:toxin-activating lysine-acyltransferase [Pantoea vagans]|uniref:toxin-activating lysine-acyltransferase n=1 Tax=Pantoea vagans TaxID=470934 RepID=UPI00067BBF63|nr:toxin-activating lysine-acyltransferase [Pantoea vagans]